MSLLKLIYDSMQFNIPTRFSIELEKMILNFICPLCCRRSRDSGILQCLPHACICFFRSSHTRFLSLDPSHPQVTDIFGPCLISRFLCLLPGKEAFESPFSGIPLLPDSQWPLDSRVSTSSSEARGTLHVAARPSIRPRALGGRPWPCRAGPMRRRVGRGPASRLGARRPRGASQPSVAPPSEDPRKEPTPEMLRDLREQVESRRPRGPPEVKPHGLRKGGGEEKVKIELRCTY